MISFTSPRIDPSTSDGNGVSPLIGNAGEMALEARQRLAEAQEILKTAVTDRPILVVAAALAAGVILGWLIKRR